MKKRELKYIGRTVDLKTIRDFIIDTSLCENDTILLNYKNFDDLVLEYRKTYGTSMNIPYFLCGVLITEDQEFTVPLDRIGVLKN